MARALQEGVERLRHGNAAGAVLHLERALLEDPHDPRVWQSLGSAYEECGQAERALHAWREAARLSPDSPAAHTSLGLALERTGDLAGALEAFNTALRLQPRHPRAQEALRRVEAAAPPPSALVPAPPQPPPVTAAERGAALAASLEQLDDWLLPGPPPLAPPEAAPPEESVGAWASGRAEAARPSAPPLVPPLIETPPAPTTPPDTDTPPQPPTPTWRSPLVIAAAITAAMILTLVFLVVRSVWNSGPAGQYVEKSLIGVHLTLDREGRFAWSRKGVPWRRGRYTVQGHDVQLIPGPGPGVAPTEQWTGTVEPDGSLHFGPETYVRYQE